MLRLYCRLKYVPFGRIFLIVALIVSLVPRALSIFHDLCNFYSVTQREPGGGERIYSSNYRLNEYIEAEDRGK